MSYQYRSPFSELKAPEGGWLAFYQNMSEERQTRLRAIRETHSDEIASIEARRRDLVNELRALDGRQSWLEGLQIVAQGLGTIRTRRVGMTGTLNVYRYDSKSPTGVLHSGAAAPDDDAHRREAAQAGTVYAGAY